MRAWDRTEESTALDILDLEECCSCMGLCDAAQICMVHVKVKELRPIPDRITFPMYQRISPLAISSSSPTIQHLHQQPLAYYNNKMASIVLPSYSNAFSLFKTKEGSGKRGADGMGGSGNGAKKIKLDMGELLISLSFGPVTRAVGFDGRLKFEC